MDFEKIKLLAKRKNPYTRGKVQKFTRGFLRERCVSKPFSSLKNY